MRAYHYIKYNESTSLDSLLAHTDSKTTLCFDFEDSIQDCLSPANTTILKTNYRRYFDTIVEKCNTEIGTYTIGIRINAVDSPEYVLDLEIVAKLKQPITIFAPKIDSSIQILKLHDDLKKVGAGNNEIIPVIETKKGLDNLAEILKNSSTIISGIALGHCDYNLDTGNYPFFHQDSREYWTWITKIAELTKPYNLCVVNSPFLQLDNNEFFHYILYMLYAIGGNKIGQITLTQKQTSICNFFPDNIKNYTLPKLFNRLDQRVPLLYAEKFIASFEKSNNLKGFSIDNDRTILSPQEYFASKVFLHKIDFPEINFTFVGGCFPVQGDLPFENLFHQLLKQKLENSREIKFNVNIIRYERFRNCRNKIEEYKQNQTIDILVFSIRPEPFLRLVKLYYKFMDSSTGRKKWSLNLPIFNNVNPEKHDLLSFDARYNLSTFRDSSLIHKTLINLNYIFGLLLGNANYSQKLYLDLVNEVIEYSRMNNIKLFILGPPIRANTRIERLLSKRLDKFIRKAPTIVQDNFISGSEPIKNGEYLFKNGIYANEKYHELIAERMLEKIQPTIDKIAAVNRVGGPTRI